MGVAADGWIALATSFISQDGRAELTTVTRPVAGTYDTSELTSDDPAPLTFQVNCAPIDYGSSGNAALQQMPSYNNTMSYKTLYFPGGTDYAPQIGDIVTLDRDWTILQILNEFETESVKCAYLVQIGA